MTNVRYDTVIYDLDGTLLNTLDDLAASVNHAMRTLGHPEHSTQAVCAMVGNGMEKLLRLATPEGADWQEALRVFKAHYADHANDHTCPYAGIEAMLEALHQAGVRQAIVSNKGDPFVKDLNERYFSRWIDIAVGEQPAIRRKPWPDSVLHIMERLGSDPSRTLYVGDSDVDIVTAQNAGVDCASVVWGFRTEAELREAGAARLVADAEALTRLVLEG